MIDTRLPESIEAIYALAPIQEGMLFASIAHPDERPYLEQGTCELEGEIDEATFSNAWKIVAARHGSLRTGFCFEGMRLPVQVVLRHVDLPVHHVDLRLSTHPEKEWAMLVAQDRKSGFDLTNPPLCRIHLVRFTDASYRLLWTMHHLIHDAWSTDLLMREILQILSHGDTARLPVSGNFRNFVAMVKQNDWAEGEHYWAQQLSGSSGPTRLPKDGMDGAGYVERWLDRQESAAIESAARQSGVTPNALVHAALSLALAPYSKKQDVLFGTVFSGRNHNSLDTTIMVGPLINTLPIRIPKPEGQALGTWLRSIQTVILDALVWEHMPLNRIRTAMSLAPGESLFDVSLVFQNAFQHLTNQPDTGLAIRRIRSIGYSPAPLTIRVTPLATGWWLEALVGPKTISQQLASTILDSVVYCLHQLQAASLNEVVPMVSADMSAPPRDARPLRVPFSRQKPSTIRITSTELAHANEPWGKLPLVMEASRPNLIAATWILQHKERLTRELLLRGGVLLREFAIANIDDFRIAADALELPRMEYKERSTPRTLLGNRIYTSTEYPADQHIAWHNEFSYSNTWPMKILFCCLTSPMSGGETPIADSRSVYHNIDPVVRARFEKEGVLYVRNYGQGVDLSWQEAFQTDSKEEVEEHCRRAPLEWEWLPGDRLRTKQRRPATTIHPITAEPIWFNQAHLFHVSNLGPVGEASMRGAFSEPDLPRNAYYGDGDGIPSDVLDQIRQAYRTSEVCFRWQSGDLLILDNMLVAHGRRPFEGNRLVLTAMLEPFTKGAM